MYRHFRVISFDEIVLSHVSHSCTILLPTTSSSSMFWSPARFPCEVLPSLDTRVDFGSSSGLSSTGMVVPNGHIRTRLSRRGIYRVDVAYVGEIQMERCCGPWGQCKKKGAPLDTLMVLLVNSNVPILWSFQAIDFRHGTRLRSWKRRYQELLSSLPATFAKAPMNGGLLRFVAPSGFAS